MFRQLPISLLQSLAHAVLLQQKPEVIAVTGSYGKTSTKDAIAHVLSAGFAVRKSPQSYNNELGVPLTIIGGKAPGRSPLAWLRLYGSALLKLHPRSMGYPRVLILEMGADHPGDIALLAKIAPPTTGVVMTVGSVHTEFYEGGLDAIAAEKSQLVHVLPPEGLAVLNADDGRVRAMRGRTRARVRTFGIIEEADVRATGVTFVPGDIPYVRCQVAARGERVPLELEHVISPALLYAVLAAIVIAREKGMPLEEAAAYLADFRPPPGRMNPIPGVKGTLLLDDSYNASPDTVRAALRVLAEAFGGRRRWAVLGDMGELGSYSVEGHEEVGREVARQKIEYLVTVGERSRDTARAARASGMRQDQIFVFSPRAEAGRFLKQRIRAGDILLLKGSQNAARMEKIVKELMAEPLRASELLVRQGKEWG